MKQAGLFDAWVTDCLLAYANPNAPTFRDLLGKLMLAFPAGARRYAHVTALRTAGGDPAL